MANTVKESCRQSFVVMKNEIQKFFSGKRMIIFLALLTLILGILTFAPYLLGKHLPGDPGELSMGYITMSPMIVLMAASLFASISVVSEYEERTALIIFTRPIRKVSIFAGKFMASFGVNVAFITLYYLITALVSLIVTGSVDGDLWPSLGLSVFFAFSVTGIAMFFSSFVKKSSLATIFTFVTPLIILPSLSLVLGAAGFDVTWLLDQAAESISNCSEAVREMTNAMLEQMSLAFSDPNNVLNISGLYDMSVEGGFAGTLDAFTQMVVANYFGSAIDMSAFMAVAPDIVHDMVTMFVWGLLPLIAGFLLFIRREF